MKYITKRNRKCFITLSVTAPAPPAKISRAESKAMAACQGDAVSAHGLHSKFWQPLLAALSLNELKLAHHDRHNAWRRVCRYGGSSW